MKQITCVHCGDTYPDFDVAHVCSKGPYAPKLKPRMNERIKELALKAGGGLSCIAEPLEHPWKFSERELEKFAELIVRECAKSLWTEECHNSDLALEEFERNSAKIKKTFRS